MEVNRIICTYLGDSGFSVKGVFNAPDAFTEMYNNLYDIIVSDIMMPVWNFYSNAYACK